MLRCGPGLQDAGFVARPQSLLTAFLLSLWKIAFPATQPRPLAVSSAEAATSAVMRSEGDHPTTMRVHRPIAVARQSQPCPVRRQAMSPQSAVVGAGG